jgi:menaquinone-specific isochorismate synthase
VSYEAEFHALQEEFSKGTLSKAVPYVRIQAQAAMREYLLHALSGALSYHLSHPGTALIGCWGEEGGILGVTPELLCKVEKGRISTMACAGTALTRDARRMLSDGKLRKEHAYVIDGLIQDLEKRGRVNTRETEVRSFGRLSHLLTPIELESEESAFEEIIPCLHPTAALGAYPKQAGKVWLKKYAERIPRSRYGAPAGVLLNESEGVAYVAIRSLIWEPHAVFMYTGGGVLKESLLEEEKKELQAKLSAIQEQLNV